METATPAQFRDRLQRCIDKAGSLYAFAKRSGLSANTIRRYLCDSEPTRPMLLKMAEAAGVTVAWLALGAQETEAQSGAYYTNFAEFDSRLQRAIAEAGSLARFVAASGIAGEDVRQLRMGRVPTEEESEKLAALTKTPLSDWIPRAQPISERDDLFPPPDVVDAELEVLASLEKIDTRDRFARSAVGRRIADSLGQGSFEVFRVTSDAMKPSLEPGDLVIVKLEQSLSTSGIYLFEYDRKRFLARVYVDQGSATAFSDNPAYRDASTFTFPSPGRTLVGRGVRFVRNNV